MGAGEPWQGRKPGEEVGEDRQDYPRVTRRDGEEAVERMGIGAAEACPPEMTICGTRKKEPEREMLGPGEEGEGKEGTTSSEEKAGARTGTHWCSACKT